MSLIFERKAFQGINNFENTSVVIFCYLFCNLEGRKIQNMRIVVGQVTFPCQSKESLPKTFRVDLYFALKSSTFLPCL